jgi:GTPase SAR1 family protein
LDTVVTEEYESLRDTMIRGCCTFIIVYSITSIKSFEEVEIFYKNILKVKYNK